MKNKKIPMLFALTLMLLIQSCSSQQQQIPLDGGQESSVKSILISPEDFNDIDIDWISNEETENIFTPSPDNPFLIGEMHSFLGGLLQFDDTAVFFSLVHWVYIYSGTPQQDAESYVRDFSVYDSVRPINTGIDGYDFSQCGFINTSEDQYEDCVFVAKYQDRVSVISIHLAEVFEDERFISVFGNSLEQAHTRITSSIP